MDIGKMRQLDSIEHELKTPDGEATGVLFYIAGPSHQQRQAYQSRAFTQSTREFNRRGKAVLPEQREELEQTLIDRACACTVGWSNLQLDGAELPYTPEAARRLYGDEHLAWVRDDVLAFADNVRNFIPSSSSVS